MSKRKRFDVLVDLMNNKNPEIGAEIGCLGGRMTAKVLKKIPSIKKYYAIDSWEWYSDYKKSLNKKGKYFKRYENDYDGMNKTLNNFKKRTEQWKDKIKILKMFSNEAVFHIPDKSLDFCFIDANHSYEYVKEDIKNYIPKMKKGGLLGGHDYDWIVGGVKEAVNEMFNDKDIILDDNMTWWVWMK